MVESIILMAGIGLIVLGAIVLFYAQKKSFQSQLILNQAEERAETARQMIENEKKKHI